MGIEAPRPAAQTFVNVAELLAVAGRLRLVERKYGCCIQSSVSHGQHELSLPRFAVLTAARGVAVPFVETLLPEC